MGVGSSASFVGRDHELEVLNNALEQAGRGRAHPVLVEGEAGMEKTRLVEHVIAEAGRRGFYAWTGAADELERERPFGPLIEALGLRADSDDPSRAAIGRLLSVSTQEPSVAQPSYRERVIGDIVSLVEEAASERPVALVIEDVHWADPSTMLTLRRLVRRVALVSLTAIYSFRPSQAAQRLATHPFPGDHLVLAPLESDATAALANALLGATPGPNLLAAIERAGGNPFFVTELLQALRAEDAITISDGVAEFEGANLPRSLRLLILRRLSFLSEEALDVLRVAAILGGTFTVEDLSTITGHPPSALAHVLREAVDAGLLRPSGDRLAWGHDLVRDAIYNDVPLSMRRALHLQSARALASGGLDSLKIATHFSLGASLGDVEAISWLRRAAAEARAHDAAIQAELLERALDLVPAQHRARDEIELEHAGALLWSGRVGDAETLARAILDRAGSPEMREAARSAVSLALFFQNRMGEAGAEFEAAAADPSVPVSSRPSLLAQAAMGHLQGGNPEKAAVLAEAVVALGEKVGDHFAAALGYSVLAWIRYFTSYVSESIDLQRRAAAEAELDSSGEANKRHPFLTPGLMLLEGDLLEEATDAFRSGLELGERLGIVWHMPLYHYGLGMPYLYSGKWDDMRAEFETGWALAEETGSNWGTVAFRAFAAWTAVHRDELDDARRLLDDARVALENQGPTMESVWTFWANGAFLEASGRLDEGLTVFSNGWDVFAGLGLMITFRLLGPDLVRMAVAAQDIARAEEVAGQVEEHAERAQVSSAHGAALQCRGLAADSPEVLLEAVAAYRESPRVVHFAFAAEDAGACLIRNGRHDEGQVLMLEAVDVYERAGMRRDARRAEGLLRSIGVKRGARGRRDRPRRGWDSLTNTEERVATLAAGGLTNPQIAERLFISRRTVETHMSHVLAKVGLTSRVELAAEAARRAAT